MMNLPPDVAEILDALLSGIREALGQNLVGVYLRGSLATGDFDPIVSDLDYLAVTERPVSEGEFSRLAALHVRLGELPNRYARELEGAFVDREAVRCYRPRERYPTIGRSETLAWTEHRGNWILERWTVREQGVALLGPDPRTLIDPVSADELREAARHRLRDWADWAGHPEDPDWQSHRGHKAYVVETMCRALYTLEYGELPGKQRAVAWALETFPEPWRSTVERSRAWRNDPAIDPSTTPEVRRLVYWAASRSESGGSS